jgi:hypothetical protein
MKKGIVLGEKLTFGKYKDKSLFDVAQENPQYLLWCDKNIPWFNLDEGAHNYIYRKYCEVEYRKAENYCMAGELPDWVEDACGSVDQGY